MKEEKPLYKYYKDKTKEINKKMKIDLNLDIIDYEIEIKKYNIEKIDNDINEYYKNIIDFIQNIFYKIKKLEEKYSEIFSLRNNIEIFSENTIIDKNRKKVFLENICNKPDVLKIKYENFYNKILIELEKIKKSILNSKNINEKIINNKFSFVLNTIIEDYNNYIISLENTLKNFKNIEKSLEANKKWNKNNEILNIRKLALLQKSLENGIEKFISKEWINEWENIIEYIENKYTKLIDAFLKNTISEYIFEKIEYELIRCKENVNEFYEEEREGIYTKYHNEKSNKLLESLDVKKMRFEKINDTTKKIESNITQLDKNSMKWILMWNNEWHNDEIFKGLDKILEKDKKEVVLSILDELYKMKELNMQYYIEDIENYIKYSKKREQEYNLLLYKMRKEIEKEIE